MQVLTFLRTDVKRKGETSPTLVAILPSKTQQRLKLMQHYPTNLGSCIQKVFGGVCEHQASFLRPGSMLSYIPSNQKHPETTYLRCTAIPRESLSIGVLNQLDVGMEKCCAVFS